MTSTSTPAYQFLPLLMLSDCRCDRDDEKFLTKYPEAEKGAKKLLHAIRENLGLRRNSRNGTPEQQQASQNQ